MLTGKEQPEVEVSEAPFLAPPMGTRMSRGTFLTLLLSMPFLPGCNDNFNAIFRQPVLTREQRAELVTYVRVLDDVFDFAINPNFYRYWNLKALVTANDQGLRSISKAVEKTPAGVNWRVGLNTAPDQPIIETSIATAFTKSEDTNVVRSIEVSANIANIGIPDLAQFMDPETNQFKPTRNDLSRALVTFLKLPVGTRLAALYKEPSKASDIIQMMAKFGTNGYLDPTIEATLSADGDLRYTAQLPRIYPQIP